MFETVIFPDPRTPDPYGLVAIGGNYHPRTLLAAYRTGIFPWPADDLPYAWYSPDPRFVLPPAELHIGRSLRKTLRRGAFHVTFDTAFDLVIEACATVPRKRSAEEIEFESSIQLAAIDAAVDEVELVASTWIVPELMQGFRELHRQGYAHSVETWREDRLVGGLYGLAIGGLFCGESMFAKENDASKVALVALAQRLLEWDFQLIDCQIQTDHLAHLGARDWPRERFLDVLDRTKKMPTRLGPWTRSEA